MHQSDQIFRQIKFHAGNSLIDGKKCWSKSKNSLIIEGKIVKLQVSKGRIFSLNFTRNSQIISENSFKIGDQM